MQVSHETNNVCNIKVMLNYSGEAFYDLLDSCRGHVANTNEVPNDESVQIETLNK